MGETSVRPGWDTGDWSGLPPVTIRPYDPEWPARYATARDQIAQALAGLDVRIEHVGSTSVPGLGARPGIDILIGLGAGLTEAAGIEVCVARLQEIGFRYHFSKPGWTHLSGNGCKLHLTPVGSELWTEQILFRDYLRRHPEAALAYDRLKRELVLAHGSDGKRYVDGKTAFVRAALEQARQEEAVPTET
jgi:GrpB-like predicted nucleotidyltransferase (UPF0157 family)